MAPLIGRIAIGVLALSTNMLTACAGDIAHAGTTFYVSPAGDDGAAGSQSAPFKTVAKATSVAEAGDTIVVKPGVYKGFMVRGSGTARAPIVLCSEVPGKAVIVGSVRPLDWAGDDVNEPSASGNNYVTLKGFTFDHTSDMAIRASTGWVIDGVTVQNSFFGVNIRGSDVTVENSTFNNINSTNAH